MDTETHVTAGAEAAPVGIDDLHPNALGLIRLGALCPLLGMTFEVARRKHALGILPIKAFRLGDSRRGPLFVHLADVEALIARRRQKSAKITAHLSPLEIPNAN